MKICIDSFQVEDRPAIEAVIRESPEAFTKEGRICFLTDLLHCNALVARDINRRIVGVVVWVVTAAEAEVLWLAVSPRHRREGIGRQLVESVLARVCTRVVTAKTADPSKLPETGSLTAGNFQATIQFFGSLGFEPVAIVPGFWAPDNDAVLLLMRLWQNHESRERGDSC